LKRTNHKKSDKYHTFVMNYSLTFSTVSISGAYFFMVVSTPAFNVMVLILHDVQAPSKRTFTCLLSSIEISVISPPSDFKNGRISSNAFSIFSLIVSEAILLNVLFETYFFTAEQPAIVVIFIASVGGRLVFLATTSSATFRAISTKASATTELACNAAGRP